MKYKYRGKIYSEEFSFKNKDVFNLLLDLEEQNDIEVIRIEVYNIKNCDGYYTDEEIDEFLEELSDMDIIEKMGEE